MSVTIVALPERNDRVWKISSEKIPHMTLLLLGEVDDPDDLSQMLKHVEHTTSTMRRFWLNVDRRGVLGPDDADVLFFDTENADWLTDSRGHLLGNPNIKKAYESVTQFPTWIPHLTLGYPDTPANDDELDYGIYGVHFDRIALWTDTFEGPEFLLPKEDSMVDMAMSDRLINFLAHYGVKGMKWGVRKRSGGNSGRTKFSRPANKLSNAEIKRRIDRLETEKKYDKLNKGETKGKDFVEDVLSSVGRNVAKTVLTGASLLAIKTAVEAKFGAEAAAAVTRRLK